MSETITGTTCQVCLSKEALFLGSEARSASWIKEQLQELWDIEINPEDFAKLPPQLFSMVCSNCGSIELPQIQGSSSFYQSCHSSEKYSRSSTWDYSCIEKKLGTNKKVLDVGVGDCKFSDSFIRKNEVTGLDIDAEVLARNSLRGVSPLSDLDETQEKFDYIHVSHFLEHIEHPRSLLISLQTALSPGGILSVTVPDGSKSSALDGPLGWPPHHLFAYSKIGLSLALRDIGLKKIRIKQPKIPRELRTRFHFNERVFDFMISGRFG